MADKVMTGIEETMQDFDFEEDERENMGNETFPYFDRDIEEPSGVAEDNTLHKAVEQPVGEETEDKDTSINSEDKSSENGDFGLDFVNVRLRLDKKLYSDKPITSPFAAVELVRKDMEEYDREYFVSINLNSKGQPINVSVISIGGIDQTQVDLRQVFKTALLSNATSCLFLHNHPSGVVTPSIQDRELTKSLIAAGRFLNIGVCDHIIVGRDEIYSFASAENKELWGEYVEAVKKTMGAMYSLDGDAAVEIYNSVREDLSEYAEEKTENKKSSFRDAVADAFIKSLEEDPKGWVKKWASNDTGRPFNMASGKKYNGINAAWLKFIEKHNGWEDPRWLTFSQVKSLNEKREEGNKIIIPKGTKMTQVEYFFMWDNLLKKTIPWDVYNNLSPEEKGQRIDGEGNILEPGVDGNKVRERYVLRSRDHYVFNASQLENMPEFEFNKVVNDIAPSEVVNRVAEGMGVKIKEEEQDRAFYTPLLDRITLPLKSQFDSDYDYQATALHELGHATGHEKRLNRDIKNRFGTPEYAFEELIAEMTSCFMGEYVESPMSDKDLDSHIGYVQSWIEAIGHDKNYLFKAIKEANKAADYMIEKGNLEELKKEREVASFVAENTTEYAANGINERDRLSREIDAVLNNEMPRYSSVKLAEHTPQLLQDIGLNDYPILFSQKHTRDCLHEKGSNPHWHGLSKDFLLDFPDALGDPAIVLDSMSTDDSLVIITGKVDADRVPVLASLRINGEGIYEAQKISSNYVTSIYGKDNFANVIESYISSNSVLYVNKEKTQNLESFAKLQLLGKFSKDFEFNTIIHKSKNIVKDDEIANTPNESYLDDVTSQLDGFFDNGSDRGKYLEIIDAIAEYMVKDHEDPEWKITDEFEDIENIELAGSDDYLLDENGNEHPAFVTLNLTNLEVTYEVDGNKNFVAFENFDEVLNWVKGNDWDSYMQEAKVYMTSESAFDRVLAAIPGVLRDSASMVMQYIGDEFNLTDQEVLDSFFVNLDDNTSEIDLSKIGLAYSTDEETGKHDIQVNLNLTVSPEVSYLIDNEVKKIITFDFPEQFEEWFRFKEFSTFISEGEDIIEENYDGIREVFVSDFGVPFTVCDVEVLWQEGSLGNGRFINGQKFESVAALEETLKKQDREFRESEVGGYDKIKVQISYITPNKDIHYYTDRFDVGDGEEYMQVKRNLGSFISYAEQPLPAEVEITDADEEFVKSAKEKYAKAEVDDYNIHSEVCDYLKERGLLENNSWDATNKERFIIHWFESRVTSKGWDGTYKVDEPIIKLLSIKEAYNKNYIKDLKDGWYYAAANEGFGYVFMLVDHEKQGSIARSINVNSLDLGFAYALGRITDEEAKDRSEKLVETAKEVIRENIRLIDPDENFTKAAFKDRLEYGNKTYEERYALDKDVRRIINSLIWKYDEILERICEAKSISYDTPFRAGDFLPDATKTLLEGETYEEVVKMDIKEALDVITSLPYYDHIMEYAKYLVEGDKAVIQSKFYEIQSLLDEEEVQTVIEKAFDIALQDKSFRDRLAYEESDFAAQDWVEEEKAVYEAYAPVFGYVYNDEGLHSGKEVFLGTPENMAHYIMYNQAHPVVITDMMDNFVISSVKGGFLDRAADPDIRQKVIEKILPIQLGDVEPINVLTSSNMAKSPYEELAEEIDAFMYDYDTYSYMDEIEDRREAVESTMALLEDGDTEGIVDYLMGVIRDSDNMVVEAAELLDKIEKLIPQSTVSFYVAGEIEFQTGGYQDELPIQSAIDEYRAMPSSFANKGIGIRLGMSEWTLVEKDTLDLSILKVVPHLEKDKKVQEAVDYLIKNMPELTIVGLEDYLVDDKQTMPKEEKEDSVEDGIKKELASLGYNLEMFGKKSNHPDDNHLYTVLAYKDTILGREYAVWSYNTYTGLQNGSYNLDKDLGRQFYYEKMHESLRPPYWVTMYVGKYSASDVKDVSIDELIQNGTVSNTFAYFDTEEAAKEYIKESWRSTFDTDGKDVVISQIALELCEFDEEGDLVSKELLYHTEKPVEYNPNERTMSFEPVDEAKCDWRLVFEANGSKFEVDFNTLVFNAGMSNFAEEQIKGEDFDYWDSAKYKDIHHATDEMIYLRASEGIDLIDRKLPGSIVLTEDEKDDIKEFFYDGIRKSGFNEGLFEAVFKLAEKQHYEESENITVANYNYKSLEAKALSDKATQEDINRLGEWFERFGDRYWNGERFTVDEKQDKHLYPMHKQVGEDEFEIVGYSFSRVDPIKEKDKAKETDDELE